jgi:DNA primase
MMPQMTFADVTRAIVIGADGDAAGSVAAGKAAEAFAATGLAVRIMRPNPPFKDFNDELMGARS